MIAMTLLLLAAALVAGIVANSRVRPYAKTEVQGVKLELMVSPLLALTTLLLAFVLVQSFGGYNRARLSAGDEAGKVLTEARLLGFLGDENAREGQAALICYARAVSELEWPRLAEGLAFAPEVSHWGIQLGNILTRLAVERNSQPYGTIVATDRDRIDSRRKRVIETRPAVPIAVSWLMLGVSVVAIFSIATFTLPYVSRRVQIGALSLLALVFASVQIVIVEIDTVYDGWIKIEPQEMRLVSEIMENQMITKDGGIELPCDESGLALDSG